MSIDFDLGTLSFIFICIHDRHELQFLVFSEGQGIVRLRITIILTLSFFKVLEYSCCSSDCPSPQLVHRDAVCQERRHLWGRRAEEKLISVSHMLVLLGWLQSRSLATNWTMSSYFARTAEWLWRKFRQTIRETVCSHHTRITWEAALQYCSLNPSKHVDVAQCLKAGPLAKQTSGSPLLDRYIWITQNKVSDEQEVASSSPLKSGKSITRQTPATPIRARLYLLTILMEVVSDGSLYFTSSPRVSSESLSSELRLLSFDLSFALLRSVFFSFQSRSLKAVRELICEKQNVSRGNYKAVLSHLEKHSSDLLSPWCLG